MACLCQLHGDLYYTNSLYVNCFKFTKVDREALLEVICNSLPSVFTGSMSIFKELQITDAGRLPQLLLY